MRVTRPSVWSTGLLSALPVEAFPAASENMNAAPMSRRARRWRCAPVPESSQSTTVLAPISTRLSSPKPASATELARQSCEGEHEDADDVPAERDALEPDTAPEQLGGRRRGRALFSRHDVAGVWENRARAIPDQMSSTTPKGQAPERKP